MLNLARSGADEPLAEAFPSLSKARLWPPGLGALSPFHLCRGDRKTLSYAWCLPITRTQPQTHLPTKSSWLKRAP